MEPHISVIIPARNEEQQLPRCLASIARAANHIEKTVEVIVVVNRCTDRTEEVARSAGCTIVYNQSKNLSQIRNSGVAAAQGEIIVTVDADSILSENMLVTIDAKLSNERVVGGGVTILPERFSLGIVLTGICILPLLLRHGISAGLFFFRKNDFAAIHGFDESLASVEDLDFARRLKQHGCASGRKFKTLVRAHIRTSCRKFDQFGDWYMLRNPRFFCTLLRGNDQAAANTYWYDIER